MIKKIFLIHISFLILTFGQWSFSQSLNSSERVSDFQTYIVINQDSSLDVTENITVLANQSEIKHGIIRSLPLNYVGNDQVLHRLNYNVMNVSMNQKSIRYDEDQNDTNMIIRMGDANTVLNPGLYQFQIQYRVTNVINYFKDGDQLYWNVIGTSWKFPIEKSKTVVQLPSYAKILQYAAYTGAQGSVAKNYVVEQTKLNQLVFQTTKILQAGEGITIAVAWQKGIVHQPTLLENYSNQFKHPIMRFLLACAFFCFGFYGLVWLLFGNAVQKGTIIPLFQPPLNLTPAAMRYIYKRRSDTKALTSTIVNLAVNGFLLIEKKIQQFQLTLTQKNINQLHESEKNTLQKLFGENTTISLSSMYSKNFSKAEIALYRDVRAADKKYFKRYSWCAFPSFIVCLVALLASLVLVNGFIIFVTLFCAIFLYVVAYQFKSNFTFIIIVISIILSLFLMMIYVPESLSIRIGLTLSLLILTMACHILTYQVLTVLTPAGQKLLEQIEGFKLFIETTDRYRLEQFNVPDQTPEVLEKIFPYAIALDVESQWDKHFTQVLVKMGLDPKMYNPSWNMNQPVTMQLFNSLNSNLPTAMPTNSSSVSSSSISSSASSGSGSSGSGSGGGGGSGW